MRFFKTAVSVALAAFAAVASAQASTKANAITEPIAGAVVKAGEPFDIKWMNVVGQQVTLTLMDGPVNDPNGLKPVATIITNVPNTGSYTWNVPENLPASTSYSIRISYDTNPNNFNYSDRFIFQSEVTATSSGSTTSAPSTTSAATTSASSASSSSESETTTTGSNSTTTVRTTTRRTSTSENTSAPTSDGAPPNAGSATMSSPIAVIMAVLAAALFIH